jgi:hypothetical protein
VECNNKNNTGNNRGDWNHFKITQTIPEQPNRKARNEGKTKKQPHTARIANVNVQNTFHRRNNITCSTNCKYRTAAKLHTLETRFVSGIFVNTMNKDDIQDNNKNFQIVKTVTIPSLRSYRSIQNIKKS